MTMTITDKEMMALLGLQYMTAKEVIGLTFGPPSDLSPIPPPSCDCGAAKAKTTHSHWCSTRKEPE